MSKPTPGPWELVVDEVGGGLKTAAVSETDKRLASRSKRGFSVYARMAGIYITRLIPASREADARLIATSPELLVLVKEFARFFETYSMQDMPPETLRGELEPEVFERVMAQRKRIYDAITKAEGRTNEKP